MRNFNEKVLRQNPKKEFCPPYKLRQNHELIALHHLVHPEYRIFYPMLFLNLMNSDIKT